MSKSRCCVSAVRNDDKTIRRNFHSPGQVPRCPRSVHTLRCFDAQVKRSEIALPGIFFIHLRCNVQVLTIANRTGPFCVILCLLHSVATSEPGKSRRFCSDIFSVSGLITRISAASDFCRKEVTWSESSACVSKWTDANDACEMNCFVHWPRSISSRVFEQSWILYLRPHALELGELERLLKKGDLPKSEYFFNNLIQFASSYSLTFLSSSYPSLTARVLLSLSIQASTSVSRAALRWVGGPASIVGCPLPG